LAQSVTQNIAEVRLFQPLRSRDFRLLFSGQTVSLFGDQFYLVALPLLTLDLVGSGAALGGVLMVGGVSRAFFDLIGGAASDQASQRSILLRSNLARAAVAATLTFLALFSLTRLWHLYLLSMVFGVVDAFFFPAFLAILPRLIDRDHLIAGNALMRGSARLMGSIGPAVAGLVITGLTVAAVDGSVSGAANGGRRFTTCFAIDAATFLFAAFTVWKMREHRLPATGLDPEHEDGSRPKGLRGLLTSIIEGFRYVWRDRLVRSLLIFVTMIEFAFIGPSTVGLAVLARTRLAAGDSTVAAGAYAAMLSAFGFGMLAGMVLGGTMRIPRRRGRLVVGTMVLLGIGMCGLGFASHIAVACSLVFPIGLAGGLSNILLLAWMQSRSDARMLGRVLSVAMFSTSLVEPLSYALAGIVADVNLTAVFVFSGAIMLCAALASLADRVILTSE
jgi:hypothetical protein